MDELLRIETAWPGTTIDGEPGINSGSLDLSSDASGEFLLNISVGPPGAPPEDFTYLEFPLSREHARALSEALASGEN